MTMTMTMMRSAVLALAASAAAFAGGAPAQAQAPVEIPLSVRAGRMVIPAETADGARLTFLVTTGSAVTVLSESGAARVGDGGVTIGGVPVEMAGRAVLPDGSFRVAGEVVDGMVGINTLNRFDVLFDAPGGRLVLKPVGRSVAWPGVELADPVRLRVYHGVVLALDVAIDGVEYPAMLELGAPSLLANRAVLEEGAITGGRADLTLGTVTFPGLPIQVSDHQAIERFSPNGEGFVIVGAPPAVECAVAVSWVHREMRTCRR